MLSLQLMMPQRPTLLTDYSGRIHRQPGLADGPKPMERPDSITHVDVKLIVTSLEPMFTPSYSQACVNTAEHELGHAIGLDHDDSKTSVTCNPLDLVRVTTGGYYYGPCSLC